MSIVGIPMEEQDAVFRAVAAVLHLGNIDFEDSGDEAATVAPGEAADALAAAADLLGVDSEGLRRILTTRTRQTPDGPIVSPIDVKAAEDNRDSLSKTLYSRMFDWLVDCINRSIGQDPSAASLIGVLDIYGFEQFAQNDFEQFCINLANEKLQQHFNQHVFKMEQAEYEREGIQWSYIEFVDNQDVLDLIEAKMGVLDLLDETCRFPKATHEDFAQKLYSNPAISGSKRFSKPRLAKSDFTIAHYAGEVTYRTENFLSKNKDFVVAEHQSLLGASSQEFVRALFPAEASAGADGAPNGRGGGSSYKFSSVGSRFKRQLGDLMEALHTMEPHYIRCIKPNSFNRAMEFENSNVLHQLRCGGVLEAVRISCAGYPTKPRYEEFVDHFWPLATNALEQSDSELTRHIVHSVLGPEGSQFGKTRVFLRAGRMAELDKRRTEVLNSAATTIQRHVRGWMARLHYQRTRNAIIVIQAAARALLARKLAQQLRANRAAIILQAAWRRHQAQSHFKKAVHSASLIQARYRWYKARLAALEARTQSAVLTIQAHWRRHVAQSEFLRTRHAVIKAQTAWRVKLAKRELRLRRAESRESGKLLQDKQALETKLKEVQTVLQNLQDQRNQLRQQLREEKAAREAAGQAAKAAEAAAAAQVAAASSALAEELAAMKSAREAAEAKVAMVQTEAAASVAAAAKAHEQLELQAEELRAKVAALEKLVAEKENMARGEIESLMNRVMNLTSQRDQAREELVMTEAKLKQTEEHYASMRHLTPAAGTPPSGAGHLVATATPTSQVLRATPGRENAAPMPHAVPGGRSFDASNMEALSEMDRRQRELYAKQQQLLREQRTADQERLLDALKTDLGFQNGRPVAAVLVFRCCLQWKALQADRTTLFDRINQTMGQEVERLQEDNDRLAYWLSNTVALFYLMQKHIKPASGGGYASRLRQTGQQAARGLFGSAGKSISAYFGRAGGAGTPGEEASIHGGGVGAMAQVEARYPALLFKQQLDAFVQRIFPMLRDNVKKEIAPHLSACIVAAHGGRPTSRRPTSSGESVPATPSAADASIAAAWKQILSVFNSLLVILQANHVPPFLVRKLFEQLFSFVNVQVSLEICFSLLWLCYVLPLLNSWLLYYLPDTPDTSPSLMQLFNQLLLRRECCSFSNGEHVKTGLSEVELWVGRAGREWLGDSWDQLAHIRQAVTFLVIHQKAKKSLNEIMQDLCPVLSVQQLYRISTMYWDDRYGTETVSHEVLARMKQLMVEGQSSSAAGHSFLLDDDSTIPFTQEDICSVLDGRDLLGDMPVPAQLAEVPSFSFLSRRLDGPQREAGHAGP